MPASPPSPYDIAIIGGGVNGCGIARDAAGRGLSVCLIERDDLAAGTSQASTKLVHGGLRYLEHYAFRLVREALIEREVLLAAAPHIIWPLRFVLPHDTGQRPAWMLRAGLFLYDHLGGREMLPGSRALDLTADPAGVPLQARLTRAFEYSDCWVDDARLVVLNAVDAAEHGAEVRTRTRVVTARVDGENWTLRLRDSAGAEAAIAARALVVAAGPWVGEVVEGVLGATTSAPVRLVKGSHLIVHKLYDHDRAYMFQNPDGRVVFAIPYEHDFTLIGTTDEEYTGDPATPMISPGEVDYLLASVNRNLRAPADRSAIVRTYAGIRPLYDDGASAAKDATRDYVLDLDAADGAPPRLTIYGGKITTYRRLAEHALDRLAPFFPAAGRPWTARAPLPGGDFSALSFAGLVADIERACPFLGHAHARRLARLYGTRAMRFLQGARRSEDLGRSYGPELSEAEVSYLVAHEFARTADDVLWRRTKTGLRLSPAEAAQLKDRLGG
jgi:glycerol-3-phosphate dehydrogenase